MKKQNMLLITGILALTGMTGCGTGEVQELLDESRTSMGEISSASGDMETSVGVNLAQMGLDMDLDLVLSGEWEMSVEPSAFHFDGELGMDVMDLSTDFEIYGVEEEDKYVTYTKVAGQWSKFEGQAGDTGNWDGFYDLEPDSIELSQENGEVNGKETRVIRTEISGENVIRLLEKAELWDGSQETEDISALKAEIDLEIYKESNLPAAVNVDFGESLNSVLQSAGGELAGLPEVGNIQMNVNVTDYDTVDSIAVPEEALAAEEAEGNPLQDLSDSMLGGSGQEDTYTPEEPEVSEDGAYILESYDGSASAAVTVPEGYDPDYLEKTFLSFSKMGEEDFQSSVIYQITELSDSYTEDDLVHTYMISEDEAKDYGYVSYRTGEVEEMELDGMKISCLATEYSYEESSLWRQTVLWSKLDDTHILQCMVTETAADGGQELSMDEELVKRLFSVRTGACGTEEAK